MEPYVPDSPKPFRKAEFSPKFSRSRSREASPDQPQRPVRGSGRENRTPPQEEVKERTSLRISKIRVRDISKDSSDSSQEKDQENISDNLIAVKTRASSDNIEKMTSSVVPFTNSTETVPPKNTHISASTLTKKKK